MSWMFFGELFIRSALLLAAVEAARRIARRRQPKYRHAIAVAGFALLAALPLLWIVLPPVYLPAWFFPTWLMPVRASVTVTTGAAMAYSTGAPAHTLRFVNWPVLVWIAGAALCLLRIAVGRLLFARRLRRGIPVRDESWTILRDETAATLGMRKVPRLIALPACATPLAFGFIHPAVVLPENCKAWTEARKRIVLLHELSHIRRRDAISQLFAGLVAALWWFQPLVWLLRRRLRQESEHACDARVLAAGVRASDYAVELIDIARSHRVSLVHAGACIARPSDLEIRLSRILAPASKPASVKNATAIVALIAVAAIAAPAFALNATNFTQERLHMKRTLLSGLMLSATLSAATISGTLFDTTGVAIPDAKLVLHSAETSADLDSASGPDGKFSFSDLAAGQYILRAEKTGFTDLLREFTVNAGDDVERGLVMQVQTREEAKNDPTSSARQAEPFTPGRLRVNGEFAEARLIRKVQPVYPAAAKAAHVQGTVRLKMIIRKDGTPAEITVASSPSSDLSESALEAVRQWRYKPILLNGEPIEVLTDVIVNYTLSR